MRFAKSTAQSSLSLPPDSYIYTIAPLADTLVASCSDNSLRILSPLTLRLQLTIPATHIEGVTCLATQPDGDAVAYTAGRDGFFRAWDSRVGGCAGKPPVLECGNGGSGEAILSLAVTGTKVAVGTELTNHTASVSVWDVRQLAPPTIRKPLVRYTESHNDDVTALAWHPGGGSMVDAENVLLSGSTDGLVNLYDTSVTDEDEAVVRTWNHGSVGHAGWMDVGMEYEEIYAVSHDEQLGLYRVPLSGSNSGTGGGSTGRYREVGDGDDEEKEAVILGDVRPKLDCEYVAGVTKYGDQTVLGAGKHSDRRMDLVPLTSSKDLRSDADETVRLQDAHGEEVVRSFYMDAKTDTIYTGGEDGMVRAWRVNDEIETELAAKSGPSRGKGKKGGVKERLFKPY